MDLIWYKYLFYNHLKHFWRNSIVDRLNRHGVHCITFSDERIRHYAGRDILNKKMLNELISQQIESGKPFLISRLGGCETKYTTSYLSGNAKKKRVAITELCTNAGFFPPRIESADHFAQLYIDSLREIDICGVWRYFMEDYLLCKYAPAARLSILEWLEPWRAEMDTIPWSHSLKGKKVLVVHPFSKSIEKQYHKNREQIFQNRYKADAILPEFELITFKAVQSMGGKGSEVYETWFEAFNVMTDKIRQIDFDIAIVGCGAYGLPLAAKIKQMGKQAIHLGGATQLFFGIMGGRWNKVHEITLLQNDAWVHPSDQETPYCAKNIENGCYW